MYHIINTKKFLRFVTIVISFLIIVILVVINNISVSTEHAKKNLVKGDVVLNLTSQEKPVRTHNIQYVHINLMSSATTKKQHEICDETPEQNIVNNTIISISEEEIDMLVQAVQHEVGNNPYYFPGYNFDYIQQCMTRVIINRVGKKGFANSVTGVLSQPGHFMPLEELSSFDENDKRTRKNVLAVLYGEDNIADTLVFEMSFTNLDETHNIKVMEKQVGDVIPYYAAITADNRYLLFALQV